MDIFQSYSTITADTSGIYITTKDDTYRLTGPPLTVWQKNNANQKAEWKQTSRITMNLGRAFLILKDAEKKLRGENTDLPFSYLKAKDSEHIQEIQNALTYLRNNIIGKELFEVISKIGDFELHMPMCWLAARIPEYAQLILGRPFIAGLLAQRLTCDYYLNEAILSTATKWTSMTDRSIIELLGFPSKSRRFLQRATPCGLTDRVQNGLRRTLQKIHVLKTACHLQGPILRQTLEILADPELIGMVTPKLINALHNAESKPVKKTEYFTSMLYDAATLSRILKNNSPVFNSITKLRRYSDIVNRIDLRRSFFETCDEIFPAPPFEGTDRIVPLITPEMILQEAVDQGGTCVSNTIHVNRILRGQSYIYKVLWPVRATLEIEKITKSDSKWQLRQLLGKYNSPVPKHAIAIVLQWMNANQGIALIYNQNPMRQLRLFD